MIHCLPRDTGSPATSWVLAPAPQLCRAGPAVRSVVAVIVVRPVPSPRGKGRALGFGIPVEQPRGPGSLIIGAPV